MTCNRLPNQFTRLFLALFSVSLAFAPTPGITASVTLANEPMANATVNAEVLPNLMISFDDSGSMGWRYLPDWVGGDYSLDGLGTSTHWTRRANAWNQIYYNPALTYSAPAYFNADGSKNTTTYLSMTGETAGLGGSGANADAKPNWKAVRADRYGKAPLPGGNAATDTTNIQGIPANYRTMIRPAAYVVQPGEYCLDAALRSCKQQTAPDSDYKYAAPLRWCKTAADALLYDPGSKCQAARDERVGYNFTSARYPSPRQTSITINTVNNNGVVTNISVNGKLIMAAPVTITGADANQRKIDMANGIVAQINACNGIATGNCTTRGYAAWANTDANPRVFITAGTEINAPGGTTPVVTSSSVTLAGLANFSTNSYPGHNLLRIIAPGTTALYPYPGTYPGATGIAKAPTRTDCAGTLCTGNEEMINFANWYAYYGVRSSSMKTAMSLAFEDVGAKYRIGIQSQSRTGATNATNDFLGVGKYELAQRNAFLNNLFGMDADTNTPTRRALSNIGRYFAGAFATANSADPVQYSCQKHYAFLATDGYWNGDNGVNLNGVAFNQNMDSLALAAKPKYEGPTATSQSLADIAKYYYEIDLRAEGRAQTQGGKCTPGPIVGGGGEPPDEFCRGMQSLTTFGMAFGIPGTLTYTPDYLSTNDAKNDYVKLKAGTVNWPPAAEASPASIDDLWHSTVNSEGIYFSAKSPADVVKALKDALTAMDKKTGSGAAAASSSLQPTAGDNFMYVASYATVRWTGNLEARQINTTTGAVTENASWCVEDVVADSCPSTSTIVANTSGSSTTYVCRPPIGPDVEIALTCTGTLPNKVTTNSDTRSIFMASNSGSLTNFSLTNIGALGFGANYTNVFLRTNLNQRTVLTTEQLDALDGDKLVAYLRGQRGYEMRDSNAVNDRLFRARAATLGDIISSQPNYRSNPRLNYKDAGYDGFKAANAGVPGTVYVGANDGMLHAFDGATGEERWTFIPTPVIAELWRLADDEYAINHRNYTNGSPVISDIFDGSSWRTILVSGLSGGGRGYFALDITDPLSPTLLWEFTSANDSDLGFTYGNPVITKMDTGEWVVLVTSGYNNGSGSGAYSGATEIPNTPPGSGQGYLYVLNAKTGDVISNSKLGTGSGSATTPSGLARILSWANDELTDNTATYTYGGDLNGDLWRFDINTGDVMKFAAFGSTQPITSRPELGKVNGKRMVFVGTGKYLEKSDLSTTASQSVYGIMDDDVQTTLSNPQSVLVQQFLTGSTDERTITNNTVDYNSKRGWFYNFSDVGERQHVDPLLAAGVLINPSTVPKSSFCSPGGYGWLNYVNYKTGGSAGTLDSKASVRTDAPIVGINIVYTVDSTTQKRVPRLSTVTANDPTPKVIPNIPFGSGATAFTKKKVQWRELIQ